MAEKRKDLITIEPYTKITGFDGLGFAAQKSLIGAIGGNLYPNDKDLEKKKKFYISPIGRRNKQKVAQLVSEVYAYLNSIISEHADPRQYYFRLYVRMAIDSRTGEIFGDLYFDIDVFRHIGKIGGKPTDSQGYTLKVVFIGKESASVSTVFIKGISEVAKNTGMIDFKPYESYLAAPKEVRDKINREFPYLIVGDDVYAIKIKVDNASKITAFVEDDSKIIEFNAVEDVALFILKKIPIKPQIIGSETAFEPVDQEITRFSAEIRGNTHEEKRSDIFNIASLGIDSFLLKTAKKFLEKEPIALSPEASKKLVKQKQVIEEFRQKYDTMKTNYEVTTQEIDSLEKERNDGIIEEDSYRCTKKRRLLALAALRTQLINTQQEINSELIPQTQHIFREVNKLSKEKVSTPKIKPKLSKTTKKVKKSIRR